MLGFGGSSLPALPAFAPVSVSGIGSVRTGIRLRWASASVTAANTASNARPDITRFMMLCDAIGESTIPLEGVPYLRRRSACHWCGNSNQVGYGDG
jgi:hypothetical protein